MMCASEECGAQCLHELGESLAPGWPQLGASAAATKCWMETHTNPTPPHADMHTYRHTYRHTYILTYTHACRRTSIHTCIHTDMLPVMYTYIHKPMHTHMGAASSAPVGSRRRVATMLANAGGEPHAEYAGLPHVLGPETAPLGLRATGQRHRFSRSTPSQLTQSALDTQLKMRRIQHGACTCSETVSDHIGGGCGLFVGRLGDAQTNTGLSQFLCTPALWVMSPTR